MKAIEKESTAIPTCGLIMPISAIDNCSAEHWTEVKSIVVESLENITGLPFTVRLVSEADDIEVIQKRIVQNVYTSDIVVCDVSGKNPNVMFELGMRLAFDKPTVIIKDDKTDYSFDTGVIEHLTYPRDLRFAGMVAFKTALADKVSATYQAAKTDPDHSVFLKNFGTFKVASLSQSEVSADQVVLEMLTDIQQELGRIRRQSATPRSKIVSPSTREGKKRLYQLLNEYRIENPNFKLNDITELENFVMSKFPAPQYFQNPEEFKNVLDEIVTELIILENLSK